MASQSSGGATPPALHRIGRFSEQGRRTTPHLSHRTFPPTVRLYRYDITIFGGRRTRSSIKELEVWHSPELAMMKEARPYRTETRQKRTYI